jgi:hypothetical protein
MVSIGFEGLLVARDSGDVALVAAGCIGTATWRATQR